MTWKQHTQEPSTTPTTFLNAAWWFAQCDHKNCNTTTEQPRIEQWTITPPTANRPHTLHHCPQHHPQQT